MSKPQDNSKADSTANPSWGYLNYFGKERSFHLWFANKRTQLMSAVFPAFTKLGLAPDTISYVGISLLAGVVLYFVRSPLVAVFFLALHVICDGVDGAFARYTGKASQSGAFTDLVCDQLGMVTVALTAIFHHMVSPVLGAVYVTLYLIVVVFGVIINVMGLKTRITITSKYFLYIVYGVWAFWGVNLLTQLMTFFSVIMVIEVTVGYLRLKRGIRRKFDAQERFTEGDPYSGRLNYTLNISLPLITFGLILYCANTVPIAAMFDRPKAQVSWEKWFRAPLGPGTEVIGCAAYRDQLLVMTRDSQPNLEIREIENGHFSDRAFSVPEYLSPALSVFPVDGSVLLIADAATRLLLGFDLEASFAGKRPVVVEILPMEHLRVSAMGAATYNNKTVWHAANYLYTRKTYTIDPDLAQKKGKLLGGVIGCYVNAGFPSGMAVYGDYVFEYNKTPGQSLIYAAKLSSLNQRGGLMKRKFTSFLPPVNDAMGPIILGEYLVMITRDGQTYKLTLKSVLGDQVKSPAS